MSADYEGTVVQNEAYRVKKLSNQIRALEATNTELNRIVSAMQAKYDSDTSELKAQIKRFINNGIQLPKGRPNVTGRPPRKRANK